MKGAFFLCLALHLLLAVSGEGETKVATTQKDAAPSDSSSIQTSTAKYGNDLKRIDDDILAISTESKEVSSDSAQQRQDGDDPQQQAPDPSPRFGQRVRGPQTRGPAADLRPRLSPGQPQRPSRLRGRLPTPPDDSSDASPEQASDDNPGLDARPYAGRPQPSPMLRSAFAGASLQRPSPPLQTNFNNPGFFGGASNLPLQPVRSGAQGLLGGAANEPGMRSGTQGLFGGAANEPGMRSGTQGLFGGAANEPGMRSGAQGLFGGAANEPGLRSGAQGLFGGAANEPGMRSGAQGLFGGAANDAARRRLPANGQVLFNSLPAQSLGNSPFGFFPPRSMADPRLRAQFPFSNEIAFSSLPGGLNPQRLASANSPGFQFFPQVHQSPPILVQPSRQQPFFSFQDGLLNLGGANEFTVPDFSAFGGDGYDGLYGASSDEAFGGDLGGAFVPDYPPPSGDVIRVSSSGEEDQQQASDASREDGKASKQAAVQADNDSDRGRQAQRSNPFSSPFGVPAGEDVFVRYPVGEAGYAVEERANLANATNSVRPSPEVDIRNLFARDPYRDAINGTRDLMPVFRDAPIDFGYQRRPEAPPFALEYQEGLRASGQYRPLAPLGYPFVNGRQVVREADEEPQCAKANNASFCFEDEKYPWQDVLYSLNTNTFLMDRMSGPEVNATAFLESGSEGKFACDAEVRTGGLLRARSLAGAWRVVANARRFAQIVRTEVCRSGGDPCSNVLASGAKTSCVQKYSVQRLLAWSPERGIFTDLFRIPVACSCQVLP